MRYYCPNCWADFWEHNPDACPHCHYDMGQHDEKDYVDKLLAALNHRVGEVRHWAIMILAMRKERRAIPHLKRLRRTAGDPLVARAAEEAIRRIESGRSGRPPQEHAQKAQPEEESERTS